MHFKIECDGDINIIHPVGRFDGRPDCEQLQMLVTEIAESGCRKVVFSFSLTRWINSCGVEFLRCGQAHRRQIRHGRD